MNTIHSLIRTSSHYYSQFVIKEQTNQHKVYSQKKSSSLSTQALFCLVPSKQFTEKQGGDYHVQSESWICTWL